MNLRDIFFFLAILLGLAVVYQLHESRKEKELEVIKAPTEPYKVRPEGWKPGDTP